MAVDPYQIEKWSYPPEGNEQTKCLEAMARIKSAVDSRFGTGVNVFIQGAYKNGMNVKSEAEVDIVLEYTRYYFSGVESLSAAEKRKYESIRIHAEYPFDKYKQDVYFILQEEFGAAPVQRRNKSLLVRGHKYRVNAVVVPCFSFRRFSAHNVVEAEGIALMSDSGSLIESYPNQHHESGVAKNRATREQYGAVVRVLKNVRDIMAGAGLIERSLVPSFLLESLVWNIPDQEFDHPDFYHVVKRIVSRLCGDMDVLEKAKTYQEVCGLQRLMRGPAAERSIRNAQSFMKSVYDYIGF